VISVVRIGLIACEKCSDESSELPYHFSRQPSKKHEGNQNFPTVFVPIGRDRKMIADHDKNNWNRQESIVFGSQFGLCAE
jgi:hypothetical protein